MGREGEGTRRRIRNGACAGKQAPLGKALKRSRKAAGLEACEPQVTRPAHVNTATHAAGAVHSACCLDSRCICRSWPLSETSLSGYRTNVTPYHRGPRSGPAQQPMRWREGGQRRGQVGEPYDIPPDAVSHIVITHVRQRTTGISLHSSTTARNHISLAHSH